MRGVSSRHAVQVPNDPGSLLLSSWLGARVLRVSDGCPSQPGEGRLHLHGQRDANTEWTCWKSQRPRRVQCFSSLQLRAGLPTVSGKQSTHVRCLHLVKRQSCLVFLLEACQPTLCFWFLYFFRPYNFCMWVLTCSLPVKLHTSQSRGCFLFPGLSLISLVLNSALCTCSFADSYAVADEELFFLSFGVKWTFSEVKHTHIHVHTHMHTFHCG